jgi:acyl carrier protein
MSTLYALQDILVTQFNLERRLLVPEAKLAELGVDSLDVVDLMFKIEDRFALKIKDDLPTSMVTLQDVALYIDSLVVQSNAPALADVAQPERVK